MVSSLDIFALAVGLAYIIVTPCAAYWPLRRVLGLKLRDVALGAIGYIVADGVYRAYVHPTRSAIVAALQHSKCAVDPAAKAIAAILWSFS